MLLEIIEDKFKKSVDIDTYMTLDSTEMEREDRYFDTVEISSSSCSSTEISPKLRKRCGVVSSFKDSTIENIYKYIHEQNKSYELTLKKWPTIKSKANIKAILDYYEQDLKEKGNYFEKVENIKKFVLQKFNDSRSFGSAVHYFHLQQWAIEAAQKIGLTGFKASLHFINNFKKDNGITSRKVTKIVTRMENLNEETILNTTKAFVLEVNKFVTDNHLQPFQIWNHDQSQFNYEFMANRTLSHQGEHDTKLTVQSKISTTHSYTVDFFLCQAGTLGSKCYILFQEKSGEFGPRVLNELQANCPPNIYFDVSKSGKMTKGHLKHFYANVGDKDLKTGDLLLFDSWSGHKDENIIKEAIPNKTIHFKTIPPKCTKYCQPLDVYFFRQYKLYIRRIEDFVRLEIIALQLNLRDRIFILKMHAVVFNQLSAPVYRKMLQYAWIKSGYHMDHLDTSFQNVIDISFNFRLQHCEQCDQLAFAKCAYCDNVLCFDHFIKNPHYHF